ncbi:MAG: Fic family protein [Bacteroidales bacterium]|nr:Fic family protein [Bacteroidales bacterium]
MNTTEQLYKEWLALQPLKEEYQRRLEEKFMFEFNYNSNHIEGNTLTYGQTELLLKFGEVTDNAKMKDLEDMKAHNLCLKIIKEEAKDKERSLTESFIRNLHHTMLREDYSETKNGKTYTVHAGIYKTRPNSVKTITGEVFEYASLEETPSLMSDLIAWYNKEEQNNRLSVIELASLFHYRYIRIHPFEDGNGRISRLIVNYILTKHNYPMIVVKTEDKQNYLSTLHQCDVNVGLLPFDGANATIDQITPLVEYLSKCLESSLKLSIKAAKGENIEEDDDWRKALKIKYHNHLNKPELTEEKKKLIGKEYNSLLQNIHTELSEFYSLFTNVEWYPAIAKCIEDENKDNVYYSSIRFIKNILTGTATLSITIKVELQQFLYKYSVYGMKVNPYSNKIYEKELFYNESLSLKESEIIINAIGKNLHQFVEEDFFRITKQDNTL